MQTLRVDGKAGNDTLNGVFDAPPGKHITTSFVTCPGVVPYPRRAFIVNTDPTRTEHLRQRATTGKRAPARCLLAKVVAEEGTLEPTLLASPPESSARPRASGENAPCVPRPSTRSPEEERKCRT